MVILSRRALTDFAKKHPQSEAPLIRWYLAVQKADWKNFEELRSIFPATDYVGDDLYVFNIGGNKWRLIVRIIFGARTVFIKFIGPHAEYDEVNLDEL